MATESLRESPAERFSELVGQIYDTVLDPARWTAVLGLIGGFVGAARVTLIMEDSIDPSRSKFYHSSPDTEFLSKYLTDYLMINPMRLAAVGQRAVAGDIILTTDFTSTEEYARSRFSRELLAERDLVDIAVGVLERTATTITVLSLKRSSAQGFADENVRRRIGLVAPHVQRAASIGRVFEQNRVEASTMTAGPYHVLSRGPGRWVRSISSHPCVHTAERVCRALLTMKKWDAPSSPYRPSVLHPSRRR
jgi:hypothetical protein